MTEDEEYELALSAVTEAMHSLVDDDESVLAVVQIPDSIPDLSAAVAYNIAAQ